MCGIFGIENTDDASNLTYLGLYALQHRGQESAGIVSWDGAQMHVERGMGQVPDLFTQPVLERMPGRRALGHTRYSTAGSSVIANAQPIVVKTSMGPLGIVHNGNLTNPVEIKKRLELEGSIFQTTSDTEVILHLMARNPRRDIVESFMLALEQVRGAYSLLLVTDTCLIAARDPNGFRPLVLGDLHGSPCFASESCAFDLLEAQAVRELAPGEVVVARGGQVESYRLQQAPDPARCIFEHVYFARPDSRVFGDAVSETRLKMGARLAREAPADADIVVPVPDSGLFAAMGYSRESGLPLEFGLIRNHYVGRTFIEPKQSIRHFGVKIKLNPVRERIAGKRVVLVDDSIVRGTTSRKIVRMVREGGAAEVHLRISAPPTQWPCHYGIDTPTREELIAARLSVDEICQYIEADSLAYLSLEGMLASVSGPADSYCNACWTGRYRVPISSEDLQQAEALPHPQRGWMMGAEPTPSFDRIQPYFLDLQDRLCHAVAEAGESAPFREDFWQRPEGGGGRTRVLAEGEIFEKAGVAFSHVHGDHLPAAATTHRPDLSGRSFEALGVSLVFHPRNPYAPTCHMNVRFFVAGKGAPDPIWWFGGGFDLTPYYGFEEDAVHWHRTAKAACEPFGSEVHGRFKRGCDDYFFLRHRREARGIGGLFFDDLSEWGFERSFAFTQSVGDHLLPAYLPILERRKGMPYGDRERQFQLYRRGRYVEFNLVHDRGTLFGLQSGGRTESILMSLPPLVRWEYDWHPEPGSPEAELYEKFLPPRDWIGQS